jgi:hypothetical protein
MEGSDKKTVYEVLEDYQGEERSNINNTHLLPNTFYKSTNSSANISHSLSVAADNSGSSLKIFTDCCR